MYMRYYYYPRYTDVQYPRLQLQVRCVHVGLLEENEVISRSTAVLCRKALSLAFSFMATGLGIWV